LKGFGWGYSELELLGFYECGAMKGKAMAGLPDGNKGLLAAFIGK